MKVATVMCLEQKKSIVYFNCGGKSDVASEQSSCLAVELLWNVMSDRLI